MTLLHFYLGLGLFAIMSTLLGLFNGKIIDYCSRNKLLSMMALSLFAVSCGTNAPLVKDENNNDVNITWITPLSTSWNEHKQVAFELHNHVTMSKIDRIDVSDCDANPIMHEYVQTKLASGNVFGEIIFDEMPTCAVITIFFTVIIDGKPFSYDATKKIYKL